MNESAKTSWTSARCNRLLRPLSSKIALLRKTIQSEPRHEECNSGIAPPSPSHQSLTATRRVESEYENSPRPWKKIKRTYSSRTNSQRSRESIVQDRDRACKEARDAVIRLPFYITAGQFTEYSEDLTVKDGPNSPSAQRVPPRAARVTQKPTQFFLHVPQVLSNAVSTGISNRRLTEGICKALQALLRATTSGVTRDNGGCRSLFSICLRQIPNHITEEQCLIDDEDSENDIDVASEVYNDLEAFGSAPEGGWESLREVVRAHGLNLIREAIQEGLIEFSLSRHILSQCLELEAYDEAECVIEGMVAWLNSRRLPWKPNTGICPGLSHSVNRSASLHQAQATLLTDDASRVSGALRYYVSQSGRHGFMYRQMAVMLESCILPTHWISSRAMIDCWNGVIRSITQQDGHAQSAALLLQVAVSTLYKRRALNATANFQVHDLRLRACKATNARPILRSYKSSQTMGMAVDNRPIRSGEAGARLDDKDHALQSTFFNILTLLSAVNILRSPKSALVSNRSNLLGVVILRDIALDIRKGLELANVGFIANRGWAMPAEPLHLPLLSAGLVSVVSRQAGAEITLSEVVDLAALAKLPSSKESMCSSGSFLCEVARYCDEANPGDGFHFVQDMVQDLITIATSDVYDKPIRVVCSGIAHAAAFAFSENTGQAKHLDWALSIEGAIARTTNDSPKLILDKTPARAVRRNQSGYKWEEGICEWIAKTPALEIQQPTAVEDVDGDDNVGDVRKLTPVQALSLRSGISQDNAKRSLLRPKRRGEGGEAFCDVGAMGDVKGRCSNFNSMQELLFVRVTPCPPEFSHRRSLIQADMANDVDELSVPDWSREQPVALREIVNPPSDVIKRKSGQKHKTKMMGSCELNVPPRKRRCLVREICGEDAIDELGLP